MHAVPDSPGDLPDPISVGAADRDVLSIVEPAGIGQLGQLDDDTEHPWWFSVQTQRSDDVTDLADGLATRAEHGKPGQLGTKTRGVPATRPD